MKTWKLMSAFISLAIMMAASPALAHVVVTPGQVGVGQELVFNVSAPNEQQTPVVSVKLDIPAGVTNVVPTEKPGWAITLAADSITWAGSLPVGQRDDFSFSAQAPAGAADLNWKAYQTYSDGTVVHWDQKPNGKDDSVGTAGPYSVTHVVNDLATPKKSSLIDSSWAFYTSLAALVLAVFAVVRKK